MSFRYTRWLTLALLLGACSCLLAPARAQTTAGDAQDAARRQVLESDRWRQARQGLNEWLSIQPLYSPEEVSIIRTEFQARIDKMSPAELQDYLKELENKLVVLTSPDAKEAQRWVSQFLSVARNGEEQIRAKRPDLANMTASQIRQELQHFHERRARSRQSQAAFDRGRNQKVDAARSVHSARQQANERIASRPAPTFANNSLVQSQYSPRREDLPGHSEPPEWTPPIYTVGPWGNPLRWHPMGGRW